VDVSVRELSVLVESTTLLKAPVVLLELAMTHLILPLPPAITNPLPICGLFALQATLVVLPTLTSLAALLELIVQLPLEILIRYALVIVELLAPKTGNALD